MEGCHAEYMANKGCVHAMFVECLEHAFSIPDEAVPPHLPSPSSPTSPILPPSTDSDYFLPPLANLCITSLPLNSDNECDLYLQCDPKFPSHVAYTSMPFHPAALLSLAGSYNALLDSGCTHHIIWDQSLFSSYSPRSISVGMANCGSLDALGTGDVKFQHLFGDRLILFMLQDCLYAPSAPINLLSVGALVEHGMSCLFSPGSITKVFFPDGHPKFSGLTFPAAVSNQLSFLQLSFLPPVSPSVPIAMLAQVSSHDVVPSSLTISSSSASLSFPHVKLNSMLWHHQFGHLGMDAT